MADNERDFIPLESRHVGEYNAAGILPQSQETIDGIQKWLQPTDYAAESSDFKKHLGAHVPTTGNWIQGTKAYQEWHESPDSGALWIKAVPGAGKSVLAAMITDKLSQEGKVPVMYFFFRQIIATNHEPVFMIRDWLSQLLPYSPHLQLRLKCYLEYHRNLDDISLDEFWQEFLDALASVPKAYCIVDALDEMDTGHEDFLHRLVELGRQEALSVKILMTSRPLHWIEEGLKAPHVQQIRLEQRLVDADISLYIDHRLQNLVGLAFTDEIRECIRESINTKGQGSFLYARLMMDDLLSHEEENLSDAEFLQAALQKVPGNLEDMYSGILRDHSIRSGVSQELQLSILKWVTHSSRPLRLLEMATLINFLHGKADAFRDAKALVRSACGPLLEILKDDTVTVIHHTFTEFLTRSKETSVPSKETVNEPFPCVDTATANQSMAFACLHYLTSGCLKDWETQKKRDLVGAGQNAKRKMKMRYPLLDYAAFNLCFHASKLEASDETLFSALDEFMNPKNPIYLSWLDFVWPADAKYVTPLHIAAYGRMRSYCRHLLKTSQNPDPLDFQSRTPISWASARGYSEIVAIFLDRGADPKVPCSMGLTPLHYASRVNHYGVVRLLLDAGCDPLALKSKEYLGWQTTDSALASETPLQYACQGGCAETVSEMMRYLKADGLSRALLWAVEAEKVDVVNILLEHPQIPTNPAPDSGVRPPLHAAAAKLNSVMIRALLKRGANPNATSMVPIDGIRGTAMHILCDRSSAVGNKSVVRKCFYLLLEAGSDVNAVDDKGRTPLHYCSAETAILLLENGAKVSPKDRDGNTPLHLLGVRPDYIGILKYLVRYHADLNAVRYTDRRTPLHTIIQSQRAANLKAFLACKPDCNAVDKALNSPLHIALGPQCQNKEMVEALLQGGADPNQKNKEGLSPIHLVGDQQNASDIIPILARAGADLEARDRQGRTVLLRLSSQACPDSVLATLLGSGAKVDAIDFSGNTVLHMMCQSQLRSDRLKLLIDAGADPLWVNHAGNTIFHEAVIGESRKDSVDFLRTLLEMGVSATARNLRGQTPLHLACSMMPDSRSMGQEDCIDFLLRPEVGIDINSSDDNGITPILLAASISEQIVGRLIKADADPKVPSREFSTPLHVASRARQTNVVGLLLDYYSYRQQWDFVNKKDEMGRTALHWACRSGRPETVKLLLEAGASPHSKDDAGQTPLHACAEFQEENSYWLKQHDNTRMTDAAYILINDTLRPYRQREKTNMWSDITTEHDTVRIRECVRLLIAYDADVTSLGILGNAPIDTALSLGCEDMVDELLPFMDNVYAKRAIKDRPFQRRGISSVNHFTGGYVRMIGIHYPSLLKDMIINGNVSRLCNQLLRLGNEGLIEELVGLGVDFLALNKNGEPFLETLVKWGYYSIVEKFGSQVSAYDDVSKLKAQDSYRLCTFKPLLHVACYREVSNLEMLKTLVLKLNVDVNARNIEISYEKSKNGWAFGGSALHVLARGKHWWHPYALEFLLRHGANIELQNEKGETPLHVAVSSHQSAGYWKGTAVDILLRHGANPNRFDDDGSTPLNKALPNIDLARKLIKYGANVNIGTKPALIAAIDLQDLTSVSFLLENGADANIEYKFPPVHYAALPKFRKENDQSDAVPIIKSLLAKGADPYASFWGTTVIHHLFETGGIVQPFLDLPNLNLEHRDSHGRTLLISACRLRYSSQAGETDEPSVAEILFEKGADLNLCDSGYRNAIHHLLGSIGSIRAIKRFVKEAPGLLHQGDAEGYTPLQRVLQYIYPSQEDFSSVCIDILLAAGADPFEPDPDGNSALHHLAKKLLGFHDEEHLQLIQKFLKLGLNINARNKAGETPIFTYFTTIAPPDDPTRHQKYYSALVDAGADIFARENEGRTLLHVLGRKVEVAEQPQQGDKRDAEAEEVAVETPLDVVDCFKFLMEQGLDPMAEDMNLSTALDVAAAYDNKGILELFKRD
jgi:ankyrin repeat protein